MTDPTTMTDKYDEQAKQIIESWCHEDGCLELTTEHDQENRGALCMRKRIASALREVGSTKAANTDYEAMARNFLLKLPMGHRINATSIVLEYHGDIYNNALSCFTSNLASALREAASVPEGCARLAYAVNVTGATINPIATFMYRDQAESWAASNYRGRHTIEAAEAAQKEAGQ